MPNPRLPADFSNRLDIPNALDRLREAQSIADKLVGAGVPLLELI